jgi:Kef-type K+ transport system membrane component KefB
MNFDNLVAVLAVAAAVPLILTAVPRVRVPGPVLEIVAGIVLGPAVLDLVQPDQAVRLVQRSDWRSCSSSPAWRSTSATFAGPAPA